MISKIDKNSVRKARHFRTRRYISGTQERPRLNVYRSLNNIYVQIIDDVAGNTIASASTLDAEVKAQLAGKTKKEAANIVGEVAGRRALEKGVKEVVFDRGGYLYTGRVAQVAEGARDASGEPGESLLGQQVLGQDGEAIGQTGNPSKSEGSFYRRPSPRPAIAPIIGTPRGPVCRTWPVARGAGLRSPARG